MNPVINLSKVYIPGEEIKRDPEIGKTAVQPEPAQTADLSISGSPLISSLCTAWPLCGFVNHEGVRVGFINMDRL